MTPTQPRRPAPRPPRLALIGSFVAGLAVNTISDAYPGAAPTAVGLAVFFVAAVPSSCAAAGMPRVLPTPV